MKNEEPPVIDVLCKSCGRPTGIKRHPKHIMHGQILCKYCDGGYKNVE